MYRPLSEVVPPPAIPSADNPPPSLKVAIVTGASSGIGKATSIALCRSGWRVVISARREPELQETARLCEQSAINSRTSDSSDSSPLALVVVGDVTKEEDVKKLFEAAVNTYGTLRAFIISEANTKMDDRSYRSSIQCEY